MWRVVVLAFSVLVLLAVPVAAKEPTQPAKKAYGAADKLVRGITNVITAPLELPRQIRRRTKGDNTFRGWSLGASRGLGYTIVRFAAGAYEVLTFPAPAPKQYAPVIEPEYVWEEEPSSND